MGLLCYYYDIVCVYIDVRVGLMVVSFVSLTSWYWIQKSCVGGGVYRVGWLVSLYPFVYSS